MKRAISISLVALSTFVLLIHAVVPHHHHGGYVCFIMEECEGDNHINCYHSENHGLHADCEHNGHHGLPADCDHAEHHGLPTGCKHGAHHDGAPVGCEHNQSCIADAEYIDPQNSSEVKRKSYSSQNHDLVQLFPILFLTSDFLTFDTGVLLSDFKLNEYLLFYKSAEASQFHGLRAPPSLIS